MQICNLQDKKRCIDKRFANYFVFLWILFLWLHLIEFNQQLNISCAKETALQMNYLFMYTFIGNVKLDVSCVWVW